MREEANRPSNAPLLNMSDTLKGSISASLNAILSTQIGNFLASLQQPSSLFLSHLQKMSLASPDTIGDLMGVVDSMMREAHKYVIPERNGEASGFLRNINFAVSELLPIDKQTEFNDMVGVTYSATLTCLNCQTVKKKTRVEPYMYLEVPNKQKDVDLEESISNMLKKSGLMVANILKSRYLSFE